MSPDRVSNPGPLTYEIFGIVLEGKTCLITKEIQYILLLRNEPCLMKRYVTQYVNILKD